MTMTTLNIRINSDLKNSLVNQAANSGVSLSAFVNLALTQLSKKSELAVDTTKALKLPDEPSPKLAMILRQAMIEYESGDYYGPFDSVDEMFESMNLQNKNKYENCIHQNVSQAAR